MSEFQRQKRKEIIVCLIIFGIALSAALSWMLYNLLVARLYEEANDLNEEIINIYQEKALVIRSSATIMPGIIATIVYFICFPVLRYSVKLISKKQIIIFSSIIVANLIIGIVLVFLLKRREAIEYIGLAFSLIAIIVSTIMIVIAARAKHECDHDVYSKWKEQDTSIKD